MRVTIREQGAPPRVVWTDKDQLDIGRSLTNDVVLTAPSVDPRHARASRHDERFVVQDLDSCFGIYFAGERIREPFVVGEGDVVWIGPYDLTFGEDQAGDREEATAPGIHASELRNPIEERFLEMIEGRPFDDDTRAVYADWLEENGRAHAAEMIRVQLELRSIADGDPRLAEMSARVTMLAQALPIRWRRIVARPAIERCDLRFELACPKRWDALEPTSSAGVRFCGGCKKHVFYAADVTEARAFAREGRCVAVDPAAPRSDRDLDPPRPRMMMMGAIVG